MLKTNTQNGRKVFQARSTTSIFFCVMMAALVLVYFHAMEIQRLQEKLVNLEKKNRDIQSHCSSCTSGLTQRNRMRALKEQGFSPENILDVGANQGEWTRDMRSIFPQAHFFLLEANSQHKSVLEKVGFPFRIGPVGNVDLQQVTFYKTKNRQHAKLNTGASLFRETGVFFEGDNLSAENVTMRTIDSLVDEAMQKGPFHLVKADVQGAEILALQGASATLRNAAFVLLEISVYIFCPCRSFVGKRVAIS